ncbi:MAG: small subunit ribosomal protein S4 [Limisphaerales bacterium]|jgi:small subunit ribosomal protein S4
MARYRGPKTKKARAFGEPIFGYDKSFEKKKYPPGQHGLTKRRKNKSEYRLQLMEKQKAKYTYGLLERQFANLFDKANRKQGVTGENLLQLLEARLDNTVFRLGIAPTRSAARQLITHRHIEMNGVITNIPSATLRPGDEITIKENSKSMIVIQDSLASSGKNYGWLEWNASTQTGKLMQLPNRDEIPENINEQLIVELYSK